MVHRKLGLQAKLSANRRQVELWRVNAGARIESSSGIDTIVMRSGGFQ
jgi:hypothetical protein